MTKKKRDPRILAIISRSISNHADAVTKGYRVSLAEHIYHNLEAAGLKMELPKPVEVWMCSVHLRSVVDPNYRGLKYLCDKGGIMASACGEPILMRQVMESEADNGNT